MSLSEVKELLMPFRRAPIHVSDGTGYVSELPELTHRIEDGPRRAASDFDQQGRTRE
jgi:hypothetical protein